MVLGDAGKNKKKMPSAPQLLSQVEALTAENEALKDMLTKARSTAQCGHSHLIAILCFMITPHTHTR